MPSHWPAVPWQPIRTWLAGRDSDSWPGLKVEAYWCRWAGDIEAGA